VVDALGDVGVAPEDLVLDLVDVVAQSGDDRSVVVDDPVEHGVEHGVRTLAEQVAIALHAASHLGQVRGLGVADSDHEVVAEEQVHLADLDVVGLVDVPGRSQDDEQGVVVALELGSLVGGDGVLDRELGSSNSSATWSTSATSGRSRPIQAKLRAPAGQSASSSKVWSRESGLAVRSPSTYRALSTDTHEPDRRRREADEWPISGVPGRKPRPAITSAG
jgi:hypothetical protein